MPAQRAAEGARVIDVAIVGAGAAGVGAAETLSGSGLSVRLLEASDRVGGRAWTLETKAGALDLGCGWLHSADRNPWVSVAESTGFAVDRSPTSWGEQWRDLGFPPAEQKAARAAFEAWDRAIREDAPLSDRAADALPADGAWNGYVEALSGYINGVGLQQLSIADYLAYDDAATDENWRLPDGYGTLVASYLSDVPLSLGCPVDAIEFTRDGVRLTTRRGTLEARTAIVAVPTGILSSEALRLPAEARDHVEAAAQLPLGLANKIFLSVDRDGAGLDPDSHLIGDPRDAETGSYYLRPFGRAVIEGFFGGCGAAELEAEGLDGAAAFMIDQLAGLLGNEWRKRLKLAAGSAWGQLHWARGSYSHACPGHAGARATLARPVADRLFFAGEACSPTDFSTCHGALMTGRAAARAVLSGIPLPR